MSANNLNSTASNEKEERVSEEQLTDDELSELHTLKDVIENFYGNPNFHRVHRAPYHIGEAHARISELESIEQGEDREVAKEEADKDLYAQAKTYYKLIILNVDTANDLYQISQDLEEGEQGMRLTKHDIEEADEFAGLTAKKRLKHKLNTEQEKTLKQFIRARRRRFQWERKWWNTEDERNESY